MARDGAPGAFHRAAGAHPLLRCRPAQPRAPPPARARTGRRQRRRAPPLWPASRHMCRVAHPRPPPPHLAADTAAHRFAVPPRRISDGQGGHHAPQPAHACGLPPPKAKVSRQYIVAPPTGQQKLGGYTLIEPRRSSGCRLNRLFCGCESFVLRSTEHGWPMGPWPLCTYGLATYAERPSATQFWPHPAGVADGRGCH